MYLSGTPYPIEKWTSLVEQDDPTNLPLGVMPVCRNSRFHLSAVRTRDGIQSQQGFVLPDGGAVTGLAVQKSSTTSTLNTALNGFPVTVDQITPLAFSSLGNMYIESPVGSSATRKINPGIVVLPQNASMQAALAFANFYCAYTDLKQAKGFPAVYNPTLGTLDPLSMKPWGAPWQPNTFYTVGEVVTPNPYVNGVASGYPVGGNGHTYICIQSGQSGDQNSQPAFPAAEGSQVVDNSVTWKENTIVLAQALPVPAVPTVQMNAGLGTFAAGRDVYLRITLVSPQGETTPSLYFVYQNTVGNEQFQVSPPTMTIWMQNLAAQYKATSYNIYEADVAHGGGVPATTSYKLVNALPVALNVSALVNAAGAGVAPPVANGALLVPAGNICSGLRYMVVMFLNRNGYLSGWTSAAVATYNGPSNGYQLFAAYIPTGPPGTIARVCAFTPAGQLSQLAGYGISNAGPYFWIPPSFANGLFNLANQPAGISVAEVVNGVQELSTIINDNVSTTATFNFDDNYLKATLNDVSDRLNIIQVPPCSDVQYMPSLQRMLYKVDSIPSGFYCSLLGDPESIYGNVNSIIQVAENDGTRAVTAREFQAIVYLLKEKSGHVLTASADNPGNWNVAKQWDGSGPCGPRAVDVGTSFMCYVHRSGVWIFMSGKPFRISKEIPITWSKINWAYQHTIWVMIDDETCEIRIGVPYGQSTVPNIQLRLNFEQSPDFAPPIHYSSFIGKTVALADAYKWSIDDIPANLCVRAERPLAAPLAQNLDPATSQSQILHASSNADGAVSAVIPFQFDDNGVGIDWVIESAAPQNLMKPSRLGGVQANVDGNGELQCSVLGLRAKAQKDGRPQPPPGQGRTNAGTEIVLRNPIIAGVPYSCGGQMTNERLRLRITNRKQPGVWGDVKWAAIFADPFAIARAR